jgi:hypothetical protein
MKLKYQWKIRNYTFLLEVQNLIEYLNGKYFRDMKIEEEVNRMTKTLYDPLVEQ